MKKFNILQSIIPDIPATRVMLMSDFITPLAQWLNDLIKTREASLDVKIFNPSGARELEDSLEHKSEFLNIEPFLEESIRYDNKGYKYDTLFLHLKNKPKDHIYILERIYASMKNWGGVVLVVEKDSSHWNNLEMELDNCNFVAINPIEIDEKHSVYYAKKMHGWDGAR